MRITEETYKFALERIERLLPLVGEDTPVSAPEAVELMLMSDIVMEYEGENYPLAPADYAQRGAEYNSHYSLFN